MIRLLFPDGPFLTEALARDIPFFNKLLGLARYSERFFLKQGVFASAAVFMEIALSLEGS